MENRNLPIPEEQILESEEWKPMPKLPSHYYVSNLGRCWSIAKCKIIKFWKDPDGYLHTDPFLKSLGKRVIIKLHREVAIAFVPNPNDYPQVHHIDDNKLDNAASNLRWGTHKMNREDAERNKVKGYSHRRPVEAVHIETGERRYYPSIRDVEKDGFNWSNVRQCCKGRRHKAHGYTWKYADLENVQISNISSSDKNTVN